MMIVMVKLTSWHIMALYQYTIYSRAHTHTYSLCSLLSLSLSLSPSLSLCSLSLLSLSLCSLSLLSPFSALTHARATYAYTHLQIGV